MLSRDELLVVSGEVCQAFANTAYSVKVTAPKDAPWVCVDVFCGVRVGTATIYSNGQVTFEHVTEWPNKVTRALVTSNAFSFDGRVVTFAKT